MMKPKVFYNCYVIVWLSLFCAVVFSMASAAAPAPSKPPARPNYKVATYRLKAGDTFNVTLERYPNYSQQGVMVPPDGNLSLPVYGKFNVRGKTAAQVQSILRGRLQSRMRNPRLSVTIVTIAPIVAPPAQYISVIGSAVKTTGRTEIKSGYRITEVLAAVGGLTARPEEVQATLAQRGQPPRRVNLVAAIAQPSSAANVRVRAEDVLTISEVDAGRIAVSGDVNRPGFFKLKQAPQPGANELPLRPRLQDALIASGGIKEADKSAGGGGEVKVTGFLARRNTKIPLRIEDALDAQDPSANVVLEPDDVVTIQVEVVPPLTVYIDGLVKSPSNLQMAPGTGVLEAIVRAGGLTEPLQSVAVTVQRRGKVIPVDLSKALTGDLAANLPLEANDFVQVQQSNVIHVTASGAVAKPGGLVLPTGARLLDALTTGGGLTIKAESAHIGILRTQPDGKQIILSSDAEALVNLKDLGQNVLLQEGDLVSVSQTNPDVVYITGEVKSPGSFEIKEGQSLPELVIRAGGPTEQAALTQVIVQRDGKPQTVDLFDAVTKGIPLDFPLRAGDTVLISKNNRRVLVMEAVNRPGYIMLPEKRPLTVLEAVNIAGGTLPNAKTQEIAVLRPKPSGEWERRIIPMDQLRKGNVAAANQPLQDGDVVYVPQGKASTSLLSKVTKTLGSVMLPFRLFFP